MRWLVTLRGHIAILVVANRMTQQEMVRYAATGICSAPVVPPPSQQQVRNTALDRLTGEIDITRQILSWTIASAPFAAVKQTLRGFDARLQAFDRAVFAFRHRGDPRAMYSGPGFGPIQKSGFKQTHLGTMGQ